MSTTTFANQVTRDASVRTTPDLSRPSPWHRVAWGAVIAGVVVAMALHLVLSLLGAGLSLSTIYPLRYSSPDAATFGIAAGG